MEKINNKTCQVLIVDPHPLMRRAIHQLLETDPLFCVVGETSNGSEAISLAARLMPELILFDIDIKGLSGLDILNALRRETPNSRIIVLTGSDIRSDVFAFIDAGVEGYLLKDNQPEQLLEKIRQAASGEKVLSEQVSRYLQLRNHDKYHHDPFAVLTERELDVLQEVARGLSNKQIAEILHISEETVKVHMRNVLRKLQVPSRVAAAVFFLESRRY